MGLSNGRRQFFLTADDRVHVDVVRLREGVGHELVGKTNAEFQGVRAGGCEQSVIETAAAAETPAACVESQAGAEEGVDPRHIHFRQGGGGLADAEGARDEIEPGISHGMKHQRVTGHAGKHPEVVRMAGDELREIDFTGQGGEDGDGAQRGAGGKPLENGLADRRGIAGSVAHQAAHGIAERGFRVDGRGNCHLPRAGGFGCLAAVKGLWQAVTVLGVCAASLAAQPVKPFAWDAPKVVESVFSRDLGMLDSEREEYASNLAALAANAVVSAKATPDSLADARRMLALALNLSPRNKRALVVNFQLSKGLLPEVSQSDYSARVFARLLLTRGELLEKQGGDENRKLAHMFIALAASMDPKNEDAVYASEIHRLDHGDVDWSALTEAPSKKP